MSRSVSMHGGGRGSSPRPVRLVVVTLRCDDPKCNGRCIPTAYRRRAVPVDVVERARAASPDGTLRLLRHLAS